MGEFPLLRREGAPAHIENWTLVIPPSGEIYVEYARAWNNPDRQTQESETRFHAVSEFLAVGEPTVRARLVETLDLLGIEVRA